MTVHAMLNGKRIMLVSCPACGGVGAVARVFVAKHIKRVHVDCRTCHGRGYEVKRKEFELSR